MTPAPFDDLRADLLSEELGGREWGKMTSDFVASAMLAYAGTAVVMPFEVAKTLLQVQWLPKEDLDDLMEPPEELPNLRPEKDDDAVRDPLFGPLAKYLIVSPDERHVCIVLLPRPGCV